MIERLLAGVLIIFLSPLYALIIIGYFMVGQTAMFFSQARLGLNERAFKLFKFRTLLNEDSRTLDQRKFTYGTLLRQSSLDELPQLFNVLKGDMSLVGPRPLPTYYEPLFSTEQRKRFMVKPGITGLTQINGGSSLTWPEKFKYDLQYVQHHSFWGDIIIMIKTVSVLWSKKNDGLNEKPFTGNQ